MCRLVRDAMERGFEPEELFCCESMMKESGLEERIRKLAEGYLVTEVDEKVFRVMSDTETPQGLLGVFPSPRVERPAKPTFVRSQWRSLRLRMVPHGVLIR